MRHKASDAVRRCASRDGEGAFAAPMVTAVNEAGTEMEQNFDLYVLKRKLANLRFQKLL
jgi:hypothetical protein